MSDSHPHAALNAVLGRDYLIHRELVTHPGVSAFAAKARSDGQSVEIKSVPSDILGEKEAPSAAALAARRVTHANISPLLDAASSGDVFYWITPAIEARSLRARLARGGRMDGKDALTVLRDVSAALTHAHLHGVVHGGLSPDSVLISGGSALVGDLGLPEVFAAIRRNAATDEARSAAAESLRYASPEQASGRIADARSDVYAWGLIAYELLGGRHPFAGRTTPRQMMAAHADEIPAQLSTPAAGVPQAITRLVMRCLSKDPARRPESAREVLAVLTKEMLVPPPQAPAGRGQQFMIVLMITAVALLGVIAWLGART